MSNHLEELISIKIQLEKLKDSDSILRLLKKLESDFSNYSIANFLESKIGKCLKVIAENTSDKKVKSQANLLMDYMKRLNKKELESSKSLSSTNTTVRKCNYYISD